LASCWCSLSRLCFSKAREEFSSSLSKEEKVAKERERAASEAKAEIEALKLQRDQELAEAKKDNPEDWHNKRGK
jgi:hypothetical protein